MAELKWSGKQIIDFLNLFQDYPCLWDVTAKDYLNRSVKEAAYSELLQNLDDVGMPATVEQVKKKVKSLRDTYRKELSKIKKSQESDAGTSKIYKPKLVWFSTAEVLWHGAVTGRDSSSTMEILQLLMDEEGHESTDNDDISVKSNAQIVEPPTHPSSPTTLVSNSQLHSTKRSSTSMESPRKVLKMQGSTETPTRFESVVDKLHSLANLTSEDTEDQYDKFGQHIACQLRQLPERSFILLQSKFQNIITEERLKALDGNN
ncbi:uncharacterized protein LOC128990436 [Macrosteles quadrilineatus]|uniref:uncharacterized protein LOC128990436 n=1 Tax=Macrosteles quadrilineatus TaxID=74068 RepID=UPI0023E1BEF5|nr:uncharacterized protein LOC128990436 [Macrosteles quadrilineatus]